METLGSHAKAEEVPGDAAQEDRLRGPWGRRKPGDGPGTLFPGASRLKAQPKACLREDACWAPGCPWGWPLRSAAPGGGGPRTRRDS